MAGYQNFQVQRNKAFRGVNIFEKGRNFNKGFANKSERLMEGIGIWASFYRANPHRFVKEYLGINLKLFQQILIFFMFHFHYFMYLASRGQGKTWLTAVFCCARCILYPETKIVIASGKRYQAREVIEKIEDLRKDYPNLAREISNLSVTTNDPRVEFHNGSWIKIATSSDNSRGKRANILIVDEFRMVDLQIINKVLRKFLASPRQPKYLEKPEYKDYPLERNKEIYLSSAWYKVHWSWTRFTTYLKQMMEGKKYFVCGLPYQLSIKEGLLMKEQVLDEMTEDDFDEIGWSMEMECLFFGESENSFFKFEELDINRTLLKPVYPKPYYDLIKDSNFKYEPKKEGEIRLLCCDIASMGGKENDASVYTLLRLLPTSSGYERHVSYMESMEGGHTVTQATRIRQLFDDLDCDYLVLDTQTIGIGVYDQLTQPYFDKERNKEYEPWTCINDEKMAERCTYPNALKVIYSIKANPSFNSASAYALKDALKRRRVKLLVSEMDGKDYLRDLKGFSSLPEDIQARLLSVYYQTTFLINEMINLEAERNESGLLRLKEPKNKRKDRYSSVSYGNSVADMLERELLRTNEVDEDDELVYF